MTDSESFKFKLKSTENAVTDSIDTWNGIKDIVITEQFKHLSNFWKTYELPYINCNVKSMLNWSGNCVTTITRGNITFKINNTKLYMTVIF